MKLNFLNLFILFIGLLTTSLATAQDSVPVVQDKINGQIVTVDYSEDDTLLVSDLKGVSISVPRSFDNIDEEIRYQKYKRYAIKVYPYAVEAIKIFQEVEEITQTMKKRQRKKHIKRLHKKLKKEFTEPLEKFKVKRKEKF